MLLFIKAFVLPGEDIAVSVSLWRTWQKLVAAFENVKTKFVSGKLHPTL